MNKQKIIDYVKSHWLVRLILLISSLISGILIIIGGIDYFRETNILKFIWNKIAGFLTQVEYRWDYYKYNNEYHIDQDSIKEYCHDCNCKIVGDFCSICGGDFRDMIIIDTIRLEAIIKHKIDTNSYKI
jgi:hypothetical protein